MMRPTRVMLWTAAMGAALAATLPTGSAEEIDFVEDFALAADREQALQQLIPGSEDYYFYYCLHYQNIERFDRVQELLSAWIKRYDYTPRVIEIQNRQALLTYANNPQETLELIRRRLDLRFDHQREAIGEKPNLPTRLDPALMDREQLTQRALQRHKNLAGFEDRALDWLIDRPLDPDRRRALLQRLQLPDHQDLARLVVDDLNHRFSKPFGSLPIHHQLLLKELNQCLERKPDLRNQQALVNIYLTKLQPSDDVDWQRDPQQYEALLARQWDFVKSLEPVHNSLKANVLYHWLVLDRSRGVYDKARFLNYIRLPRQVSYIEPKYMEIENNRRFPADLNADLRNVTLLPPVGNDEELVRSYLHHFFLDETDLAPYTPYISDVFLRENLAEAKIVNGLGEPEQWFSMLPPAKYQALKERIDIDFAYTNPERFAADDPVELELFVKNVQTLIVKVFEINTRNYYREHRREVNTDIDLDGLIANEERAVSFTEPPLRRVRRRFSFDKLKGPGVYVIDFIGNGRSSRVVVRKGSLRHIVRDGATGQEFTIVDEENRKVRDARLWMAGQEYAPTEDGQIVVPYSRQPKREAVVISRDDFSALGFFQHHGEQYRLEVGVYVDREALLRGRSTEVAVRTGLYLNGIPVSPSLLKNVQLTITSRDLDGVSTTKQVNDFELYEDRESTYELMTPPRLASIQFQIDAEIRDPLINHRVTLVDQKKFSLNGIDQTEQVADLHLKNAGGEYFLELLGKTGEARVDEAVALTLKHRDFTDPVHVSLQTDGRGAIALGTLADIESVTAAFPGGQAHTWPLLDDRHTYPGTLNGVAGEPLAVPYMGRAQQPMRDELALLERRGATFVADRFDALAIDNGMLRIAGLPRGDYELILKNSGRRIRLQLAEGTTRFGFVLGEHRFLERPRLQPLQIVSVTPGDENLQIQLANATEFARVHVFATRYRPAYSAFDEFSRIGMPEPLRVIQGRRISLYLEGRSIGDEYQYIIDRRYVPKFPGVMLERPSLLLNPWPVRGTETGQQEAAAGEPAAPRPDAAPSDAARGGAQQAGVDPRSDFANLDFLSEPSAILLNLAADEQGVVTIPNGALGAHALVHVVAVDPENTVIRSTSLPPQPSDFLDLRLAAGLDPQQHFTQQKQVTIVRPEQPFEVADASTTRLEIYDSLPRVYRLYAALSRDANLLEFSFLLTWPELSPDEKREKYAKYACHELNFFLYQKDAKFFAEVVQPFIANKRDKTFLDHWLLGADLTDYRSPWRYEQLNVVERILLARRIEADRQYATRDVKDRFELLPPDPARREFLFQSALRGKSLDVANALGGMAEHRWGMQLGDDMYGGVVAESDSPGGGVAGGMGGYGGSVELGFGMPSAAADGAAPTDQLSIRALAQAEKEMSKRSSRRYSDQQLPRESLERKKVDQNRVNDFFDSGLARAGRRQARQLYEQLDKTQEWAENNYYKLPIDQQNADLVTVNAFWRDLALLPAGQPFLSTAFPEASHNFTEMLFALAVLDLPFTSPDLESELTDRRLKLQASAPLVVFHEEIRPIDALADQTPILVSQNFFRHGDRYRMENGERLDKFVMDEFLTYTPYGCQIVVTNPTSAPQKLDLLLQLPVGSMPVLNAHRTQSVHVDLQPYNTQTIEYSFYFPGAGMFPHYPLQVSKNEELLASAAAVTLNVVEQLSRVDRQSWAYVSQYGTDQDVLDFLSEHNLHRTDLAKIAFRMRDKPFFLNVVDLLQQRHMYDDVLWSYAIHHNVPHVAREFLQHADAFVAQCGPYIDSPLLTINPVARRMYQHLDYRPLVNARTHQLGRRRQILNDRLFEQYHALLTILAYHRRLDDAEKMAVVYYLLLQDRIAKALDFFGQVDPERLATRLQYDYFDVFLSLYLEDVPAARDVVTRYTDYPEQRWREAFVAVERQLDEIEGGNVEVVDPENRDQTQAQLAATSPSFDFRVEARTVALNYQNLTAVNVNYYLMDLELLFSRNPFVQQESQRFSQIRPNLTERIELPADQASLTFELPEALLTANVLVEVATPGLSKSQAYYANSLDVQLTANYGQLRVTTANPGKPLPRVYVKVYARMKDGNVRFYKDGYTDLRGRFDYASLSTNELDFVDRFSLLIMSDEHGAVVREAGPPKQ